MSPFKKHQQGVESAGTMEIPVAQGKFSQAKPKKKHRRLPIEKHFYTLQHSVYSTNRNSNILLIQIKMGN